jgi:hypothetical protein
MDKNLAALNIGIGTTPHQKKITMQDKNKITAPFNENEQEHGQWLHINQDGVTIFKGMYVNGVDLGYWVESRFTRAYYAR